MMKWYILLAHPNPASNNHAVCRSLCAGITQGGGEYRVKDLCTGFGLPGLVE